MGLDMYLSKKTYVKNWNHMNEDEKHQVSVKGPQARHIQPSRISYIIEEVAYWRKANAIHKWFVDNVQGGVDECQQSYVSKEKLKKLIDLCKQVLNTVETVDGKIHVSTLYTEGKVIENYIDGQVVAQKKIAEKLLPSQSGFFFGSTEYDQYYLYDLQDTVKQLEPLLEEDGDFYYQASW